MDLAGILFSILETGSLYGIDDPVLLVFCLVILALSIYGRALLFKKAGEKTWKALVPVLNDYTLYKLVWRGDMGIVHFILNFAYLLLAPEDGTIISSGPLGALCVLCFIAMVVIDGIMKIKLARSYNRGAATAFGLIFMEVLFMLIIGLGKKNVYCGPTRRKFTSKEERLKFHAPKLKFSQRYSIDLNQRNSFVALIAGLTVSICAFQAIAGGLIEAPSFVTPERGSNLYHLFTVNSNTLAAFGAVLMVPYAVEGIRNKKFILPKWIAMFQYAGAICTTLTMLFAIFLIFPAAGAKLAFTGMNFWLHVICPIMSLVLLFAVESDNRFTISDSLLALLPFYLYALIYIVNVVLIGEAHGGWRDIYRLTKYLPATISAPLMFMFGFGIASAIRYAYNRLAQYRHNRMVQTLWSDLSPVELKVETFGLGRYKGLNNDEDNINFPIDIFNTMTALYDVSMEELVTAYAKGVSDGLRERSSKRNRFHQRMAAVIGTPEYLSEEYLKKHPRTPEPAEPEEVI